MIVHHPIDPAVGVNPNTGSSYIWCRRCGQPENQHVVTE